MAEHDIEPLEMNLWFAELEKLRKRRSLIDGQPADAIFRKAFYLLQLAPESFRELLPCGTAEDALETYLACGAYLDAAMSLCPVTAGVTLARDPSSDMHTAVVRFPGFRRGGPDCDRDPARALLGAWCGATLALADAGARDDPSATTREDERRSLH